MGLERFRWGPSLDLLRDSRNGALWLEHWFADYVNKWLKNKTEAIGWPKNCVTAEAKTEYIDAYYDREGVQLEPEKVAKKNHETPHFSRDQRPKGRCTNHNGACQHQL